MKKPDQKNLILIVLILVAVLLGSFFGLQLLQTSADLETVKTALDLLKEDANYRFASEATVSANDKQRSYYQIKGEATAQNRHISGEVLGTPVEVFYVDGIFWQKSGADGNFRQIATGELDQALKFAAELEPPSMLSFAEALSWSFDGLEEINAVRCRKLTIQQARATGWIGQYFDQVSYTLWFERRKDRLCRAEVSASSQSGTIDLRVIIDFDGYDETFMIAPPQ